MFPRNRVRQLHELTTGEPRIQPATQVVAQVDRCPREGVGELDHEPLGCIEIRRVLPVGDRQDLVVVEAQLTAERNGEILSPQTADE